MSMNKLYIPQIELVDSKNIFLPCTCQCMYLKIPSACFLNRHTAEVSVWSLSRARHCCWTGCGSGSWAMRSLVVKLSSLSLPSHCYVMPLCVYSSGGEEDWTADFVSPCMCFPSVCLSGSLDYKVTEKSGISAPGVVINTCYYTANVYFLQHQQY